MQQQVMKYPNLIVGGAPKCGTSSLYFWLSAHPEVFGSPTKETFFFADKVNRFNKNANVHEHGIERYLNYFKGVEGESVQFEATAAYLYQKEAMKAFSSWENPPKIIFLFREPSKQMYSHYKMERYRTKRTDLPLEAYIELPKIKQYVQYAEHVQQWMEVMPEGHVGVWLFEDFMRNKERVMSEICAFIGIDGEFYKGFDFEHRNESVAIKSGALHQLGLKVQPLIPHGLQKLLLPLYMKINSGGRVQDNSGDSEVLARFKTAHSGQAAALNALVPGLPTDLWK